LLFGMWNGDLGSVLPSNGLQIVPIVIVVINVCPISMTLAVAGI
jgi:hypothetical protein